MPRTDELLAALTGAREGEPAGLDASPGFGIAGITEAPRGRTWDAFSTADAPDLIGETVAFATLADGTIVVDGEQPDGALTPLADAVEKTIEPPYRAAAARSDGAVWSVIAESVVIVELPGVHGEVADLTVLGGMRELTVDGAPASSSTPALDALADEHGDAAVHAERVDGDLFAVDVFPL